MSVFTTDPTDIAALPWPQKPFAYRPARVNGRRVCVWLADFIMRPKEGEWVDFVNGNTLDCRRENLVIREGACPYDPTPFRDWEALDASE